MATEVGSIPNNQLHLLALLPCSGLVNNAFPSMQRDIMGGSFHSFGDNEKLKINFLHIEVHIGSN